MFCGWFYNPLVPPKKSIYHKPPPPVENASQTKLTQTQLPGTTSEIETERTDESSGHEYQDTTDLLLTEYGFSPEEKTDFWNWLVSLETEGQIGPFSKKAMRESGPNEESNSIASNNYYEALYTLVTDICRLEEVLKDYSIQFSGATRSAICPFCSQNTFRTLVSARTGHRDFWHCNNCNQEPSRVISFVARIEGISENQAAEFLAEQINLFK